MEKLVDSVLKCHDIKGAKGIFYENVDASAKVEKALDFTISSHEGQYRKSGEDYAVHPILVASFVGYLGGDEAMIIAALLHDVVEDTHCSAEEVREKFDDEVAKLVEGLTKIVEIRQDKLAPSNSNKNLVASALTFHKMLIASINDVRVLVIKLCDRLHNMLTIEALSASKQKRISEETLLVYAPIAHRLGMASVKNLLEDLSFEKALPEEYHKIDKYICEHHQQIQLRLNHFVDKAQMLILKNGFVDGSFTIEKRIKHYYSIYLKMQRKGISIEEVLDLVAIRVLVQTPIDCYRILGIFHQHFNPLITRFKDYIAIPKENGYQTIHTTMFDDTAIIEGQIRTFDMHKTAEYGVAAHWKYKFSGINPSLDWLNDLNLQKDIQDDKIEEFYEYAKGNLYSEDVAVFSPKGEIFTLSRGAIALDYAFEVHTEVGIHAKEAYVNHQRVPLITELQNGDVVQIVTDKEIRPRCSWENIVQTPKAKSAIRQNCRQKLKEINIKSVQNILATIFNVRKRKLSYWLEISNLHKKLSRGANDIMYLKDMVNALKKYPKSDKVLFPLLKIDRYRLKRQRFENIVIFSNYKIDGVEFDYCCNPRHEDDIMGIKKGSSVAIHHKLCSKASKLAQKDTPMVYVRWSRDIRRKYKLIVSIENKRGSLASFLFYLAKMEVDLLTIKLEKSDEGEVDYFELMVELNERSNPKEIKRKIKEKYKLIEFFSSNDVYQ
ncbi:MAG: bifunctional (p)ppGpp synthase/hydrolase [Proteobacteria bacterium]|nr:MAG: bifunctional (p)ppGpp synthase/hydrolase [Pseudomonadota bacterium]